MKIYPTITYYLNSGEVLLVIPDLSVGIMCYESDLDELVNTNIDLDLDIEELPKPSSLKDLHWYIEELHGFSSEEVEAVHFDKMPINIEETTTDQDICDVDPKYYLNEMIASGDAILLDDKNLNEITDNIELVISSELLRLANESNLNLSDLLEEAIIRKQFYKDPLAEG